MVTDLDALARTDLVLELAWHDLDVGAGNFDAGVKACLVVSISDGTTETHIGTNGAIVGALGAWITIVRPTEGLLGELGGLREQRVLLFDTVPSLLIGNAFVIPDLVGVVSEVSVGWDKLFEGLVFPLVALAHNDDVVLAAEGVPEERNRLQDDL